MINHKVKSYVRRLLDTGISRIFLMHNVRLKSEYIGMKYNYSLFGFRRSLNPLLNHQIANVNFLSYRYHSRSSELPKLTDVDFTGGSRLFGSLRNAIIVFFTIKPLLDPTFRIPDFITASEKVLSIISNRVAQNDIGALETLVTPDIFQQIKRNLPLYPEDERQKLGFTTEDIVISMISDIDVEAKNPDERTLHIYTAHNCIKNYGHFMEKMLSFSANDFAQGKRPELPKHVDLFRGFMKLTRNFNIHNKTADEWIVSGLNFTKQKVNPKFWQNDD